MRKTLLRLVALLCLLTLAMAVIVLGTYAWESKQNAQNDIYGSSVEKIPVVLIKQEKLADGTFVDNVISDTAFYLFEENGNQIGGRYLTDENGQIRVELNPGNYYFQEITPAPGYTYDLDENGKPVTVYPFTVRLTDISVSVRAYNLPATGNLLIRKIVENVDDLPLSEFHRKSAFSFTVTFFDGGSYAYEIDGVPAGTLTSGETLQLTHGQTASFAGLPMGLLYNVTEQTPEGYIVSSVGHQGNITEAPCTAEFTNQVDPQKTGALKISKVVEGEGADPNREFRFTVTINGIEETFTLQGGKDHTISGLPLGTVFTVTEEDASAEGYQALVQTYSGRIVSNETVELPFVNVYDPEMGAQTGSLTVSKEVRGEGSDPNAEFAFTVKFTGENAPQDRTFVLQAGGTETFQNLPLGTGFVVTEESVPEGYSATVQAYSGQIATAEHVTLPFVNVYDPAPEGKVGTLAVSKTVTAESADPDTVFEFSVSFVGENAPEAETFTLRAGETKYFQEIPHGVRYTVEETNAAGYTAMLQQASGVITGDQEAKVEFINVAQEVPEPQTGSLTVTKAVEGEDFDPTKEFAFTAVFNGEGAPEEEIFTLKAGESKFFENIPQGVTYTVTETDAAGYEAVVESADGIIVADKNAQVCFINVPPGQEPPGGTIQLTVTKRVLGEGADLTKAFSMTLTAGTMTKTFFLKNGESEAFTIPAGTVYELREESYMDEGYRQSIENGYGIAVSDTSVVVTNTYAQETKIEISGTKTWDMAGYDSVALPESITVQLRSEGLLVEEQTVTPDGRGQWHYVFTVPKFNVDGTEIVYEIEEVPEPGFRVSYDGYHITNTYIPPVEAQIPAVSKVIEGDEAPETVFTFVLRGKAGYPMPEGAQGYQYAVSITDEGQTDFGRISFSAPGEYSYTVYEVDEALPNWDYDSAIYTVIFTVTEEQSGLACTSKIMRNHISADSIVFTNRYSEEDLPEMIEISGTKTWNHGSNPETDRPTSVIIKVCADGELAVQKQVTEADNWQYSFNLPRFNEDGKEIVYTIDEEDIEDYAKKIDGFDLTNTYTGAPTIPSETQEPTEGPTEEPSEGPTEEPTEGPGETEGTEKPDTPSKPGGSSSDPPKTGDRAHPTAWFVLMIVSFIGLVVTTTLSSPRYAYQGRYDNKRYRGKYTRKQ